MVVYQGASPLESVCPRWRGLVREVLRDITEPILTAGAQEWVSAGYADGAAGRTMSTDEAGKRLGIDD